MKMPKRRGERSMGSPRGKWPGTLAQTSGDGDLSAGPAGAYTQRTRIVRITTGPDVLASNSAAMERLRPHHALAAQLGQPQHLATESEVLRDQPEDRIRHDHGVLERRGVIVGGQGGLESLAPDRDVDADAIDRDGAAELVAERLGEPLER